MDILIALVLGFSLDLVLGDPDWLPHPVVFMGRMVVRFEPPLRRLFPRTARGELLGGALLVCLVCGISTGVSWLLLYLAGRISPLAALTLNAFWCGQLLAVKGLKTESQKVCDALRAGDLPKARRAVAHLVGRDTQTLSAQEVIKATVETVAENTTDGIIAPMLYLMIGGAPLGMLYKAINTMDSMVGYRNETYRHFGTAAARLDDLANLLPARFAGLLMVGTAGLVGMDGRGALRIWRRDRRNHKSPNSAQTESACAGALGVQLGGNASYFGQLVEKPTIGDALRPVEAEDIRRTHLLMYACSFAGFLILGAVRLAMIL